jgi:nucleoside-diphosphate-sugar epimerase
VRDFGCCTGSAAALPHVKPMTKTALVTGAEGFIGSRLVNSLHTKAWRVLGTYPGKGTNSFPTLPNLSFVPCDLGNQQRMEQVLKKHQPGYVFHLGAQSLRTVSWADPVETFWSNIIGPLYLFAAIRHVQRPPVVGTGYSSGRHKRTQIGK